MEEKSIHENDDISIKQLIFKIKAWRKFLFRKWKTIFLMGVIGAALGLGYSYSTKMLYNAQLSFALEDSKGNSALGSYSGIASQYGFDVIGGAGGAFAGDNLIELMKSRSMVEEALLNPVIVNGKTETLAELYIDFNHFRKSWRNNPQLSNIRYLPGENRATFSLKQDSILGAFYSTILLKDLSVDRTDKKLGIVVVKVSSENELFSKFFTETLTDVVSKFYVQTKTIRYSKNVSILQRQVDSVRQELNSAISGVAASIDVNPNANPNRSSLRAPSQHRQVDVQVNTAILSELVKNLEVAKISLRNETPLIQIIDKPILPLDRKKFGKLKGLVLGGFIGVLLAIFAITVKKFYIILTI